MINVKYNKKNIGEVLEKKMVTVFYEKKKFSYEKIFFKSS